MRVERRAGRVRIFIHINYAAANVLELSIVLPVSDSRRLIVLVGVLYVLLALWCAVGYLIHWHRAVAYTLKRWGHWIVPVILIALGTYIIST